MFLTLASVVALLCIIIIGVTLIDVIRQPQPSPIKMKMLAGEIHAQVQALVEQGLTRLVPTHIDPETAYLKVNIANQLAIIDRYDYDDAPSSSGIRPVVRSYWIRPCGTVDVRVTGRGIQQGDDTWCSNPVTQPRLEKVLRALRSYSPTLE